MYSWIEVPVMIIKILYINTGVLLENTPLAKFIRNCIRDLSGIFSIHIITSEDINDVISHFFTTVCVWVVFCLYNKKKLHISLNNYISLICCTHLCEILFLPLEHNSPPGNILHVYSVFFCYFSPCIMIIIYELS